MFLVTTNYSVVDSLYCIKPDGEEVFTYSSSDLRDTWGVTTDNHGNVYIVGRYSDSIHRLRPDGTFINIILKEEHNYQSSSLILKLHDNYTFFILFLVYLIPCF
jgi:hypothetical protein